MRKLFLTSLKLDKLLDIVPNPANMKVAFVATAADPYEDRCFVEADRKKLSEMGFNLIEVDLKGKKQDELLKILKEVDIVYVTGGNTFYLLEKVRESGFGEVVPQLLDSGIIYAGASAGAVLACPTIEPIKSFDDPAKAPALKSYEGLGLVNFVILPHYGKEKDKAKFEKIINEYKEIKFILLTDEQAIIVENGNYKIVA